MSGKPKLEDDQIHHFSEEEVLSYLKLKLIDKPGKNKKHHCMRKIFCIYKHAHLYHGSLKIKVFYIPVYVKVTDQSELADDFADWRDILSKHMEIRGNNSDYVHLSNGILLSNLRQIPSNQRILFISQNKQLQFWKDFQLYYNLQLKYNQLIDFIQDLNLLQSKEEIYKTLISITTIEKQLKLREIERQENRQRLAI